MIGFLAKLPSTNTRIAVTLVCMIGTAVRYWGWGPPPGWEPWLMFLTAMGGIDAAQFFAKRSTHKEPPTP